MMTRKIAKRELRKMLNKLVGKRITSWSYFSDILQIGLGDKVQTFYETPDGVVPYKQMKSKFDLLFWTSWQISIPDYEDNHNLNEEEELCRMISTMENAIIERIVLRTDNTLQLRTNSGGWLQSQWPYKGAWWRVAFYGESTNKSSFYVKKSLIS